MMGFWDGSGISWTVCQQSAHMLSLASVKSRLVLPFWYRLNGTERWGAGVVICLEEGADLHIAQLMPLPLTVSCFS